MPKLGAKRNSSTRPNPSGCAEDWSGRGKGGRRDSLCRGRAAWRRGKGATSACLIIVLRRHPKRRLHPFWVGRASKKDMSIAAAAISPSEQIRHSLYSPWNLNKIHSLLLGFI